MPIDKGRETGGNDQPDDWQRIESERAQRDAIQRKHDETHDPSPEFEKAALPLPPEYGSHRPKHLELTPEQIADIEEFTGKSIEHVLAARDKDPRAGHNRDEQGRILDRDGNPRRTPDVYETLRSEQAAAGPRTPEPGEAAEASETAPNERGDSAVDRPRPSGVGEASAVLSEIAEELRSGHLTSDQAADRLEAFAAASAAADGTASPPTEQPTTDAPPDSGADNDLDNEGNDDAGKPAEPSSGPSMERLQGLDTRFQQLEAEYPEDFDSLAQDPDHKGVIEPSTRDEARVALDLRQLGKLPADIQRPTGPDQGDLYSPSTGEHYDIKGVHSGWPPITSQRDTSQPFRNAYDPGNNRIWVSKLEQQITMKQRIVVLDMRNANQAAIEDVQKIVTDKDWSDRVVWYP